MLGGGCETTGHHGTEPVSKHSSLDPRVKGIPDGGEFGGLSRGGDISDGLNSHDDIADEAGKDRGRIHSLVPSLLYVATAEMKKPKRRAMATSQLRRKGEQKT